jgi:hypothetical protein
MSHLASEWASEAAPVVDAYERLVLMRLAYRADDDGCGAYPSVPSMARTAMCDTETIKRRLRSLQKRGLIALGDQSLVRNFRADRRPKVYDLLIPHEWYSTEQMAKVNRQRAEKGLTPLEPSGRPAIAPAPAKTRRADQGVPNPKRSPKRSAKTHTAPTSASGAGALQEPPSKSAEPERGDSTRAVDGGSVSRGTGALQEPQTSPYKPVHKPTNHASGNDQDAATQPGPAKDVGWLAGSSNKEPTPPSTGARLLGSLRSRDGGQLAAQAVREWAPFVDGLLATTSSRKLADVLVGNLQTAGGIVYRLRSLHEQQSRSSTGPSRRPWPPHCEHPECNPKTRFREPRVGPAEQCEDCHPDVVFGAPRSQPATAAPVAPFLPPIGQPV